ncbi:ATP-binding protein [Nocardioides pakistanensis]
MTAQQIASVPRQRPSRLTRVLNTCHDIGGIYSLTYNEAVVLTNDYAKHQHGGIPRGGFLLAAACSGHDGNVALEDEEVILLRVSSVTPLPHERELVSGRMAVVRDAHATEADYGNVLDVHTAVEHSQSAFACDVVGVFYTGEDAERVEFGADLDNVWSSARYKVFAPSAKALSWIGSFPRGEKGVSLPLGVVRFSATRRNAIAHGLDKARVHVNVEDFVGKKTAVFGMTRTGKSNTIKTIVTAVYRHAAEENARIGQVIFDPQGEYANINQQDGTGLRMLGDADQVRIYTSMPEESNAQECPLRLNFYDTDLFEIAWDMVVGAMEGAEANYVRTFRSADMESPDPKDYSAQTHWGRGFMAFYGLLYRAGYKGQFANGATLSFSMKDDAAAQFNTEHPGQNLTGGSGVYTVSSPEQAALVVDWVNKMLGSLEKLEKSNKDEDTERAEKIKDLLGKWRDSDQFTAVADVFKYAKGRGLAGLRELREFHDAKGTGDLSEMVWQDMVEGRLVIVDLSIGSEMVTKTMSERLVSALVSRASERFRNNERPVPFQVVVEEAHNLFERGRSSNNDPWVRMSKEAAKYQIGMVYATQEITSVDQRILSNTANWVIAHLNSEIETRELGKYYDFGSFGDSLRKVEDRGFVRLKTYSSPYIVPVQIDKFDHAMINEARKANGLEPIHLGKSGDAAPDDTVDGDI